MKGCSRLAERVKKGVQESVKDGMAGHRISKVGVSRDSERQGRIEIA